MPPLPPATRTRLEMIATNNGFDLRGGGDGQWLTFASTRAPLKLWLSTFHDAVPIAAVSQASVMRALDGHGSRATVPFPEGAVGARTTNDYESLRLLVRRAFQLSRTLPNELLREFEEKTKDLPRTTEAERLVVQRVGQDLFRQGLLDYWEGRCAITGLAVPSLLRASHIKPWAVATDEERLDVFNGLLLAAHLDAAFDGGLITVEDDGEVLVAESLDEHARKVLGLDQPVRVKRLVDEHRGRLAWHRENLFQRDQGQARSLPVCHPG